MARLLLCVCVLACLAALATAVPLGSLQSLRSGRVHGALNQRLTREQVEQPSRGDAIPQWLTQTLDHSNLASTATFQQRYFINVTQFLVPTPRVFLMIGGEGPISPAYVSDHFILGQLAVQYGAAVCSLEHRFYGQSVPNGDSSSENLRFLSSSHALEDLVVFRKHIMSLYALPDNTVWVVFGGSYSGSLAAWARSKYPNLFHGAFATSAPVQAQLEFSQYFDVTARSLGPACSANLQASTDAMTALLASQSGRAQLQKMFNLCSPPVSANDVANFLSTMSGPIAGIVQYNLDNNAYEMYAIPQLCARLESGSDALQGLVNVWNDYNAFSNNTACTDIGYDSMIASMQATSDARSWTYQTCIEFGYFQNAVVDGVQPFSPLISLDFYTQQCEDIFKIKGLTPQVDYTNDYYGGAAHIVTSNTVFANGDIDPWHVLGNYQSYDSESLSATVLIHGTAHCADLYPPSPADLPALTAARATQDALLAQWLNTNKAEVRSEQRNEHHQRKHKHSRHSKRN